jgi:hypothetical protein
MADDKPDEAQTKAKFMGWINEALDAREEAQSKADEERAKKDAEEAAKRPDTSLSGFLRDLVGF